MQTTTIPDVYLGYWTPDDKVDPPTVAQARDALAAAHLDPDRAEPVPDSTAFRRAAAALKTGETKWTPYTRKADSVLCCQVDQEIQDEGGLHRRRLSLYELSAEGESSLTPRLVSGETQPDLPAAYEHAQRNYTWADLTRIVKTILEKDGLGAYTPKKNGGVYYIPKRADATDPLTRLQEFCRSIGMRLIICPVDTGADAKAEIADSIASHFSAEITTHAEAIAAYDHTTRGGILENRREAIRATDSAMAGLRHLTNGRFPVLRESMRELLQKISLIETEQQTRAETEQQERQHQGRRQIVAQA